MRADNSRHIIAAARRRSQQTHERAVAAIRRMDAAGDNVINFDTVAREAGVTRSWLYTHDDIREQIEQLRERHRQTKTSTPVPHRQRATQASLQRRVEAATERIHRLETENRQLRDALARTLGDRRTVDLIGDTNHRDTPNMRTPKLIGPC